MNSEERREIAQTLIIFAHEIARNERMVLV